MVRYLISRGAVFSHYIPNRLTEGYGLNEEAMRSIAAEGTKLVVTVDTGISARKEAALAKALGMDVVITDHHETSGALPEALAVVDAKQQGCDYPFKELAGVGVAFKLACAIELCFIAQSRDIDVQIKQETADRLFEEFSELLCLGTVADVVPLFGENRLIVSRGLELFGRRRSCAAAALCEAAGVKDANCSATQIAFLLAPRINAAGRMADANEALALFLARDKERAAALAQKLNGYNALRKETEGGILEQLAQRIPLPLPPVLVVCGEGLHPGVIGIVASRLAELYERPSIVISFEGDIGRASCRSFPGFDIHEALLSCARLFIKFGGHPLAAGFSIRRGDYEAFYEAIQAYAHGMPQPPKPCLRPECGLSGGELTLGTALECRKIEPCGEGNDTPLFYLEGALVTNVTPLTGGRHLRLTMRKDGVPFEALAFHVDKTGLAFEKGGLVDLAVNLEVNHFRGRDSLSVLIRDAAQSVVFEKQQAFYNHFINGCSLVGCSDEETLAVKPDRDDFSAVYRLLAAKKRGTLALDSLFGMLALENPALSYFQLLLMLDVLCEMGLLHMERQSMQIQYEMVSGVRVSL